MVGIPIGTKYTPYYCLPMHPNNKHNKKKISY